MADGDFAGTLFDGLAGSSDGINLVKNGAATQTLSGANMYTGTTTINGGTLRIGNGGTTGIAHVHSASSTTRRWPLTVATTSFKAANSAPARSPAPAV